MLPVIKYESIAAMACRRGSAKQECATVVSLTCE